MQRALDQARAAAKAGEVPVGAVVAGPDGVILACAGNTTEAERDPTAHAEMRALRAAARALDTPRLFGCDLYVTLEPCPMCAQAIGLFRIRRLVFAAYDPKGGGVEHGPRLLDAKWCPHPTEIVGGVRETEAASLLLAFFAERR